MIGPAAMIATLSDDIRGRLRGRPDDDALIDLCVAVVETGGDCCPRHAMVDAIDEWAATGFGDIVFDEPSCPHCGTKIIDGSPTPDGTGTRRCDPCDITFGPSWDIDDDKRPMMWGRGRPDGMRG